MGQQLRYRRGVWQEAEKQQEEKLGWTKPRRWEEEASWARRRDGRRFRGAKLGEDTFIKDNMTRDENFTTG